MYFVCLSYILEQNNNNIMLWAVRNILEARVAPIKRYSHPSTVRLQRRPIFAFQSTTRRKCRYYDDDNDYNDDGDDDDDDYDYSW